MLEDFLLPNWNQHNFSIKKESYFSSIYLYIVTEETKGKRQRPCDIALNAAVNYNTFHLQNVTSVRAAGSL